MMKTKFNPGTNYLKWIRIIVSMIFLLGLTFLFIDFSKLLPDSIYKGFTYLQFIPSLLHFITFMSVAGFGFIIIILLTVLFGRVYCSHICPLGALQDVISRVSRLFSKRKKRFKYQKEWYWMRYGILAATAILFILGFGLLVNLLDPYSNFGKFFSVVVRQIYVLSNNLLAEILIKFDNYTLYSLSIKQIDWRIFIYPAAFMAVVATFSFFKGRLFCNTICPVGSLLGLFSKFSWFRIRILQDSCISCGKCSAVCKSECIDIKAKTVDFSRCVGCFNCLKSCPDKAIGYAYTFSREKNKTIATDHSKRSFILQSSTLLATMTVGCSIHNNKKEENTGSIIPSNKKGTISPPGSIHLSHFSKTCTACHLCVSMCPMRVLQPSVNQYGITGFMQPYMDYTASYCSFECTKCTHICPTGALSPVTDEGKKTLQLGLVRFIEDNCVVKLNNKSCGACGEHCPTTAITMIPYQNGLTIPATNQALCIGCGACEYICPARPNKAIIVDALTVHAIAEKPSTQKGQEEVDNDFAF